MRITNLGVKSRAKKIRRLGILGSGILLVSLFCGCQQKNKPDQPQEYIKLSESYYDQGVKTYIELISKTKNPDKLYFELGKIYFDHGQLEKAIEAFKNTFDIAGEKFTAVAYYRLGDYTDALEVFNRKKLPDDEFRYYHGLTCEKLNLFDQALSCYKEIGHGGYSALAQGRTNEIEKKLGLRHIREIDSKINKIILNAPNAQNYPQAGALILIADEETEVTQDNTEITQVHYLVKILNERGKENFAEAAIEYDSTFEKVELDFARCIKPDGSIVDVGKRHIRDVSKYLNFPLYSNARIYIISFPEVAIGSCLEYKLRIKRSQLINKKDFILDYPLQTNEPIISASFTLTLPKDRKLNLKILNEKYNDFGASFKPVTEELIDKAVYRWHFKDISQIIPEANMPPDSEINPTILLSTFNSWDDFYNWWWNLAKDKIKADNAIYNKVKSLIKGKSSNLDKAREIYNFCAKEIRYVAVEYGQAGFEPHNASDIFRNKYGDCKDQAILLVTMLREAGLKAYPVLIGTKKSYNLSPDFPTSTFNHCIAVLVSEDKEIFLDPTAETASFGDLPIGDQNRRVLVIKDDGYKIEETPLYPASHNLLVQGIKIKLNNDESIFSQKNNFTYGYYDQGQRYWLLYTQPELIQDALTSVAQGISIGAKLDKYRIENLNDLNKPVVLMYSFSGPEYLTSAGSLRIMPQLAFVDTSMVSKPKRKYPLDLEFLDTKESSLEMDIPKGFIIKSLPDSVSAENSWFTFKVEYSYKDSKIVFKQRLEKKKEEIMLDEYRQFKHSVESLARSVKQRIVFEKKE